MPLLLSCLLLVLGLATFAGLAAMTVMLDREGD